MWASRSGTAPCSTLATVDLPQPLVTLAERLVDLLAQGDFAAAAALSQPQRVLPQQLAASVGNYGRTLVALPAEAWDSASIVRVADVIDGEQWSVWLPLWTAEEGRSDLQVELALRVGSDGAPSVCLENIRVP